MGLRDGVVDGVAPPADGLTVRVGVIETVRVGVIVCVGVIVRVGVIVCVGVGLGDAPTIYLDESAL